MRIAWATPFNDQSAIARYSLEVVRELRARGIDVDIVRTEIGEPAALPPLSSELAVLTWKQLEIEDVRARFDLIAVTIADHFPFNAGSMEILRQTPCVGIFHDADVRNFAAGMVVLGGTDPNVIDQLRQAKAEHVADPLPTGADLGWIASLCVGAVLHGPHYAATLEANCPGPTLQLPLCYPQDPRDIDTAPGGRFTVAIAGIINPNKQADRVLRAIAASDALRDDCVLDLVGSIEDAYRDHLISLAVELGVGRPNFHGRVSDLRLQQLLAGASAICCLRYPILEGGSASFISALYTGRPVILANAGAYAQVPEELVWRVSYGEDADDLRGAIEAIADNAEQASRRAQRAADWARRAHSAASYVDMLLPFLSECLSVAPVIEASRQLGATLHDIGASLHEPAAGRIGAAMQELFSVEPER